MTDHDKTERERFEAWLSRVARVGVYSHSAKCAWGGWQARAALDTGAVPEGWKLVPVEPTDEMVWEGREWFCAAVYRRMLAAAPQPPASAGTEPLTIVYRNWRGEVATRRVIPQHVYFGSTEWHPEPQWLMRALDADKGEVRDFAMRDMGPSPASADKPFGTYVERSDGVCEFRKTGEPHSPHPYSYKAWTLYSAPPAQPVAVSDLDREVQHYIECSDNGLSKVPRGLLCRIHSALVVEPATPTKPLNVDALAQEIRRVDGNHDLGAGALAEALMPFLEAHYAQPGAYRQGAEEMREKCAIEAESWADDIASDGGDRSVAFYISAGIRALPLPGDKEG